MRLPKRERKNELKCQNQNKIFGESGEQKGAQSSNRRKNEIRDAISINKKAAFDWSNLNIDKVCSGGGATQPPNAKKAESWLNKIWGH